MLVSIVYFIQRYLVLPVLPTGMDGPVLTQESNLYVSEVAPYLRIKIIIRMNEHCSFTDTMTYWCFSLDKPMVMIFCTIDSETDCSTAVSVLCTIKW